MTANRRQVAAGVGGADAVTVSPDTHTDPPADPPQEPSDDLHADDLHADDPRADDAPAQRSLFQKLALALAAVVSMAVLAVSGGGYVVYRYFDAQITRVPLGLDEAERPAEAPPGTENFLLVGSDSREGTGNQYQSDEVVSGQRSDTTMIAHLDANGTTTLVSFPRDTLVTIPGHGRNKLNAAITIGGPSLLIRTLENLTNIKIDHFVSIDLAGFKAMTDAIGGVTICVRPLPGGSTSNLHDEWSQWHGVVGENHLNGEQALAFVRQRYGLPDGDFDRIRRQQQFISTVFQKATSNGVLANPAKLEGLLASATGALTVDDGTTVDDLRNLANRLRGMSTDAISFETIPVREPTRADGANSAGELRRFGSVQLYDPGQLDTFLAPLRGHGTAAPNPTGGRARRARRARRAHSPKRRRSHRRRSPSTSSTEPRPAGSRAAPPGISRRPDSGSPGSQAPSPGARRPRSCATARTGSRLRGRWPPRFPGWSCARTGQRARTSPWWSVATSTGSRPRQWHPPRLRGVTRQRVQRDRRTARRRRVRPPRRRQ